MLDKKVAELLNVQINKEFYSAYLYLHFSNYYKEQGLDGFANWYSVQAQEERDHAMLMITYMQNNDAPVVFESIDKPDAVLENNPWDVIAMACSRGDASSTWSVGDTKTATVNGINMTFEIIAFGENQSHLTLANDAGKKPGIVFGTKYAVGNIVAGKDGYPGQPPFTYIGSEYYNILNSYYNGVPADLKPYIQSCTYTLRYLTGSYTEGESLPNVWESSQQQTAYLIPFDDNRANSFYPSASRRMKRHLSSSGAVISWILSDYEFAKTGGGNVPTLFNTFISTEGNVETPTGGPFTTAEECGIMFLFGFGISK